MTLGTGRGIEPFATSRDGRLVVSYDYDRRLRLSQLDPPNRSARLLWAPATAEEQEWLTSPMVAISPDGRWVAAGFADGSVRLWDTTCDWAVVRKEHTDVTPSVSFSDDGRWLLTVGTQGRSCLWKPGPDAPRASTCQERVAEAQPGGSAPWLIAADGSKLRVWNLRTGEPWADPSVIETGLQKMRGFVADPQGRWVAAYGESLVVWRRTPVPQPAAMIKLDGVKDIFAVHVSRDGPLVGGPGRMGAHSSGLSSNLSQLARLDSVYEVSATVGSRFWVRPRDA